MPSRRNKVQVFTDRDGKGGTVSDRYEEWSWVCSRGRVEHDDGMPRAAVKRLHRHCRKVKNQYDARAEARAHPLRLGRARR